MACRHHSSSRTKSLRWFSKCRSRMTWSDGEQSWKRVSKGPNLSSRAAATYSSGLAIRLRGELRKVLGRLLQYALLSVSSEFDESGDGLFKMSSAAVFKILTMSAVLHFGIIAKHQRRRALLGGKFIGIAGDDGDKRVPEKPRFSFQFFAGYGGGESSDSQHSGCGLCERRQFSRYGCAFTTAFGRVVEFCEAAFVAGSEPALPVSQG